MWNDKFLLFLFSFPFVFFSFYFFAFNYYAISNEYTNIIYIDDNSSY